MGSSCDTCDKRPNCGMERGDNCQFYEEDLSVSDQILKELEYDRQQQSEN